MGLFAFRRLRDREAASNEVAFLSIAEPKLITTEPDDGNHNRGHSRGRKRKLVPNAD
jgi:hypothetical protein